MQLSVAICEDYLEERSQLGRLVRNYATQRGIALAIESIASGEDFVRLVQPGRWDLVLMDIYMAPGHMDGMEAAACLREQDEECLLIFVTTSRMHGGASYAVHAADYLCKPVSQKTLDKILDWHLARQKERFRTLRLRCDWEEQDIRIRDICYIEIQKHTAMIHMKDKVLQTSRTITALEEELQGGGFLRCHRSYLVNMHHIMRIEKRDFLMDNGHKVPLGSTLATTVRAQFMDWVFENNRYGLTKMLSEN